MLKKPVLSSKTPDVTVECALLETALPRLERRLLLTAAGGPDKTAQIMFPHHVLSETVVAAYRRLCERRLLGEPIAYVLGEREFYGRMFRVTSATLIPRPETELLVEWVVAHAQAAARVLDLGTGSGAIAVSVAAERSDVRVWASDHSSAALAVALDNAARHGVELVCLEGDWWGALVGGIAVPKHWDIVVSNPPYIAVDDVHLSQGDLRFEPASALTDGADGLAAIRHIVASAPERLNVGGWLAIEHGYTQGAACRALFADAGLLAIETMRDYAGHERFTIGQCGSCDKRERDTRELRQDGDSRVR